MIKSKSLLGTFLVVLAVLAVGTAIWYRGDAGMVLPESDGAGGRMTAADTAGQSANRAATEGGAPADTVSGEREQYQQAYRLIEAAAKKYGVDPALAHAIALQGSFYNPRKVSSEGAIGLMQVRPGVAAGYGLADKNQLFTPEINADIGLQHLRALLDHHDLPGALFAYTTGRKPPEGEDGAAPEISSLGQRILKQYQLNGGR